MSVDINHFEHAFKELTDHPPFPWQTALFSNWFAQGKFPQSCNLPTGLGKTSVIAIWLIALARGANVPRRLVYVVNRRTVVDQTTDEVEKYRKRLDTFSADHPLKQRIGTVALSTLRGQLADNREWSADPSRPAVICGTVDMIGSRLLFSGYGVGFKGKPLHAGFLGQDVLLVHDEAHLEPAFQELLITIKKEQERCCDFQKFRVMALTATSRSDGDVFELTTEEKAIPASLPEKPTEPKHFVWQRLKSKKGLKFHPVTRDSVATAIGEMARDQWKDSGKAILIFVRTIDDVKEVTSVLTDKKNGGVSAEQVQQLTGTMRGLERNALASTDDVFARVMPNSKVKGKEGTVYLVCTSAGEVGVDISADHMVCDLSTLDSMAQRFGRVNRRGEGAAKIDVVYETDPNPKPPSPAFEAARWETKKVLERLSPCNWIAERHDASPSALGVVMKALSENERDAAFAPRPIILPATDILFDAWALTSIRAKMPGRPPVEPYLHGISDWEPPQTQVAWREEVDIFKGDLLERYKPEDLLDDYPLLPHELLRDRSDRVFKHLETLGRRHEGEDVPVWIIDEQQDIEVTTLAKLADKQKKDHINGCTILLPPSVGGLNGGQLDGDSPDADDVADAQSIQDERGRRLRQRVWDDVPAADHLRLLRTIDTRPDADDEVTSKDGESLTTIDTNEADGTAKVSRRRLWHWYDSPAEGGRTARKPVTWATHVGDVVNEVKRIVAGLSLPKEIADAVILAADLHDHGKQRERFQITLGNRRYPDVLLAKSGRGGARLPEPFRHEFASLLDAQTDERFKTLSDNMKNLVLHLIAAHHGRARPHFDLEEEAFDPSPPSGTSPEDMAIETPRRFARLQRKYGRWGLAYLESILRAADWVASAEPSKVLDANGNEVTP